MAVKVFLDTTVLLGGMIDFGPQSAPAQSVMRAVVERTVPQPSTAWHCCLEFYSVSTRLPPEFRLQPTDALQLLKEEVLGRMSIHDLPAVDRESFLASAARESTTGGRIYDAHIAEIARAAGADVIVTDNRRHFIAALRHGTRVETPSEFLVALRKTPRS